MLPMKRFLIPVALFQLIFLNAETIDEVTVIGSYLESTEIDLSPITIIDKDMIEDINISSIAEISKYISSSSGSHFQANTLGGVDQGMASITLRGLDHASTLVLINSKRHTFAGTPSNQGEGYIDVNIIPEIALDRVELLKEGATSLYGSDAVAGVINFSLIRKADGLNLDFSYQDTDNYDQSEYNFGALYGWTSKNFDFVAGFNYLDRSPLSATEIPGIAELALSGLGKTFRLLQDTTVNSGIYTGSYSKGDLIPDPNCEDNGGVLSGGRCRFLYGNRFNVVNDETHNKLYFSATSETTEVFLNSSLILSRVEVNDNPQSPSYPALPFLGRPIQASQAGNPFGVPVLWFGRPLGSEFPSPLSPKDIFQYHWSNQIIFNLNDSSDLEISVTNSMHSNDHSRPDIIDSRFLDAINGKGGSSGNEFWNIFDSQNLSRDLIDYVRGYEQSEKEASLDVLDVIYTSSINAIEFAIGTQYAKESLEINYNEISRVEFDQNGKLLKTADLFFLGGGKNVDSSRSKQAIFFEANQSISEFTDLRFAVRYEEVKNDSSFDPKISIRHRLSNNVLLRASSSTAFAMPSMAQMYSSEINLGSVRDTGNVFVRQAQLGNPDLKPATSDNQNFGLIYKANNFDLAVDYWTIDYQNRVEIEDAQAMLNQDPNGSSITRTESGDLIGVTTQYFNEDQTDLKGIDLSVNSIFNFKNLGELSLNLEATHLIEFMTPELQNQSQRSSMINRVGKFNYDSPTHALPRNRVNLFINWYVDGYEHVLNTRYIDSYKTRRSINSLAQSLGYDNAIDSFLVFDWCLKSSTQGEERIFGGSMEVGFCVINLSDEKPPRLYDAPDFSFDTRVHDPRGRIFQISFNYRI